MGKAAGGLLRFLDTFLYALTFCCAAVALGIYSYFLAVLADRNLPIATWKRAVEGISGAGVLYLIFAVILTCFLGGIRFFAFLAILLDVLFAGAFIAMAVLTRDGASSCRGNVRTPLGNGPANSGDPGYGNNGFGFGNGENTTYAPNLGRACKLNTAVFAVSIIGAFLFLLCAAVQLAFARHHQKEKRYGPSPANGYTSGSGKRKFWQRKPKRAKTTHEAYGHGHHDAELGAAGVGAGALAAEKHHNNVRPSHDTAYTGSTVAAPNNASTYNKYETGTTGATGVIPTQHGDVPAQHNYYSAPTGTAVNPYGYENTRTTANF